MIGNINCCLLSAVLLAVAIPAFAKGSHGGNDRASFGSDITIAEGESAGDVACAFCSVHVRGDVTGDVAVFMGSVTVEPGHTISGDTAIAAGDLNLGEGAAVQGDLAILGGSANIANTATVHGSRTVMPEPFGTLILLSPLLILAGLIWLVVYMVRRSRYRFPIYPQGRDVPMPPQPPR